MKHKYYSTHMKQNKMYEAKYFQATQKRFVGPHPWGNDPTLTSFNEWRNLTPQRGIPNMKTIPYK
jgi:hypothetical protein